MMLLGAIADDLTGAVELASMLVAGGVPTGLTIGPDAELPEGNLAHVIALKTRVAPVDLAVRHTLKASERLLAAGARQIFFKYCATFDSTEKGNIGPCAEALLDRLDAQGAIFCPAFCEAGRLVFQGHMFCGTQLLGESPKRDDPLTPMTDSNLVRVLQAQSRRTAGLIPHDVVEQGPETIREQIEQFYAIGTELLLADTLGEHHLESIAEAAADAPLLTGNSSVAAHLPAAWRRRGLLGWEIRPEPSLAAGGNGLVLSGSCAGRTAEQLEHFGRRHPVLQLDLDRSLAGEDVVQVAVEWAKERIGAGPVAISTTEDSTRVAARQKRYTVARVADEAERLLAEIGRRLISEANVRRLLIAGGETSGAVLARLGIERMTIGSYRQAGLSYVFCERPVPLSMVVKSGKLGPVDMMATALEDMRAPGTGERGEAV